MEPEVGWVMDAVEYLKTKRRLCKEHTDEDGVLVICPRSIEQNRCDKFDDHILMCSDCRRKYWSEEVQDDD